MTRDSFLDEPHPDELVLVDELVRNYLEQITLSQDRGEKSPPLGPWLSTCPSKQLQNHFMALTNSRRKLKK